MRYSNYPGIFVKGYGFMSFAKNMSKYIGKSIRKNLGNKYIEKILDHAKQSVTDTRNCFKKSN